MSASSELSSNVLSSFGAFVDLLLSRFSYYVVPLVLAVVTLLALVHAGGSNEVERAEVLAFPVALESDGAEWSPAQAQARLADASTVERFDTRLSEAPVWLALPPGVSTQNEPRVLELPSRHAQSLDCWRADTLAPIGAGDRRATTGDVSAFRAGFLVQAGDGGAICRVIHSGPAVVTARGWPAADLQPAAQRFHWGAGLFEGALVMLALFALFTALINRESRYVLLAVWLVGNLRLGAISMGWDTQWLGWTISPEWMHTVRQLTIAAYYVVTYTLFRQVFASELERLGDRLIRYGQRLGLLLLLAAVVLPFAQFLPLMWLIVTLGVSAIVMFTVRCLVQMRSRAVMWYAAALGLVLFASLSEVIAAAFDFKFLVGAFNSVTAALAASLLAAFAFADQVRQERRTRWRAQAELERTYQVTPVGLFTLDEHGHFLRVNNAMRQMPGLEGIDARRTTWATLFEDSSWARLRALAESDDDIEFEVSRHAEGGDVVWFLVRVARVGEWIEGSLQDITERQKFTERLRYLANYDSLTGVLNRRGIERELERALDDLRTQTHRSLAVAYLDLDRFKLINDLYGHNTGDEVLRQACERIGATLHPGLQVGRIGGDEFILVLPGMTMTDAVACCQRVIDAIVGRHFQVRTQAFQVNLSMGLVEVTPDLAIKDVISTADRACRDAKARRPGRLAVYERNAAAFAERERELQLMATLGSNFEPRNLFLLMQPIMSLHAPHASMDFEVLVRMRGPDGGIIPAGPVVAAAEANGNIAALDKWVLRSTLQWIQTHRTELARTRFICVNLSGASLNDETFLREVFGILGDFRDVAHLLCIEVTEGVALHDIDNSRRFIENLRQFGSRIALDDFGAGYTSFLYIKELSADALKIDGSFVRSITHHPANAAILEAIVQLAHNLGMRSIAEWVEDYATLELLAELGVDYVQGYLIAEPMAPERLLTAASPVEFIADPATREHMDRAARIGFGQIDSDIDLPAATPFRYH